MVRELALAKVPVPLEVHKVEVAPVALDPAVILTAPEVLQVVTAVPATAVGAAMKVSVFVATAFGQLPDAVAVKVRVTLPARISKRLAV